MELIEKDAMASELLELANMIKYQVNQDADLLDVMQHAEARIYEILTKYYRRPIYSFADKLFDLQNEIRERAIRREMTSEASPLDIIRDKWKCGKVYHINVESAERKLTYLADMFTTLAVEHKYPVGLISYSSPASLVVREIALQNTPVARRHLLCGSLTREDWVRQDDAFRTISNAPIYCSDEYDYHPELLKLRMRQLKRESNARLIVVDGLLDKKNLKSSDTLPAKSDELSPILSRLALELDVAIVLLSTSLPELQTIITEI